MEQQQQQQIPPQQPPPPPPPPFANNNSETWRSEERDTPHRREMIQEMYVRFLYFLLLRRM
jgi:hypothetical protein